MVSRSERVIVPVGFILLVVSCIVGYLDLGSIGIAWGVLVWFCSFVVYVPYCGAVIFQLVLLPWINSQIHITKAMHLIEIVYVAWTWFITVVMSIATTIAILRVIAEVYWQKSARKILDKIYEYIA